MPDPNAVGQDRQYQDITQEYDAGKGAYTEQVETGLDVGPRLPQADMPQAPDPVPFTLGATTPTGGGPTAG